MLVLHEQFGVEQNEQSSAALDHDMKVFRILDDLPSLDGFLMRDALELEGVQANEAYFDVSPEERTGIQEFIRGKMEPLVAAAYGGKKPPANKVTQLIDAMWEAKDVVALEPLDSHFALPQRRSAREYGAVEGHQGLFLCDVTGKRRERERSSRNGSRGRCDAEEPRARVTCSRSWSRSAVPRSSACAAMGRRR